MRRSRPVESTTSTPSTIPERMASVRARSVASSSTFCPNCWIEWAAEASMTLTRAAKAEESIHVEQLVAELLHGDERPLEERQFFPQAPHVHVHCARFAWILVVPHVR